MRSLIPAVIIGLLLSTAMIAGAADWYYGEGEEIVGPQKGMIEIGIGGMYVNDSSSNSGVIPQSVGSSDEEWLFFARGAYYVTDQIAIGGNAWGDGDIQNAVGTLSFSFSKPTSKLVPYLAGGLGYRWVDTGTAAGSVFTAGAVIDDDDMLWTAGGGVKYYASPDVNIFAEYMHAETDETNVEQDLVVMGIGKVWR